MKKNNYYKDNKKSRHKKASNTKFGHMSRLLYRFMVFTSFALPYSSLSSCPTCVGRMEKSSPPFFSDEYYQDQTHNQATNNNSTTNSSSTTPTDTASFNKSINNIDIDNIGEQ